MTDDRLRDIEHRSGSAARPPDFRVIAARGRRRRHVATVAAVGITVAVLGGVGVGAHSLADDQSAPVAPRETRLPTTVPTTTPPSSPDPSAQARAVVEDPRAQLYGMAVSLDDPDVRAVVWQVCDDRRSCTQSQFALAVTEDAFVHTTYLRAPAHANLTWAGGDDFVVWDWSPRPVSVVSASGAQRPITVTPGRTPLLPGETLVGAGKSTNFYGVGRDGSAHLIPMPPGKEFFGDLEQNGQTLWGVQADARVQSSPDGGRTWNSARRTAGPYATPVLGNDPHHIAVVALGEDGIIFPSALWRSGDDGASWREVQPPEFRNLEAGWLVVLHDGRLLVNAMKESGARQGFAGLYLSDDASWSSFHRVQIAHRPPGYFLGQSAIASGDSGEAIIAYGAGGAYVSTDDGRDWRPTRTR